MDDERTRLKARQDAIVRALVADGSAPEGFDPDAIARARKLLAAKRAWVDAQRRAMKPPPPQSWTTRWLRRLGLR